MDAADEDYERTAIKLRHPIKHGSEVIDELRFRPITGRDFRRLKIQDGYSLDVILSLAGRLSGQPDPVIDKLQGEDLSEVFGLVSGFMPGGPTTGSESSE